MNGVTGDFDDDGYADILIRDDGATVTGDANLGIASSPTQGQGAVYLIYGRTRANWTSAFTTLNGDSAVIDLKAELTAASNRATAFYWGNNGVGGSTVFGATVWVADLNGDGYPDILTSGRWAYLTAFYGQTSNLRWGKIQNIYEIPAGVSGFYYVSTGGGVPGWLSSVNPNASAWDINGDGKLDLLMSYGGTPPATSRTNSGAVLVAYQPSGGWPTVMHYNSFNWNAVDSFQIYGPVANSGCGAHNFVTGSGYPPFAADVRPGDKGAPEILVSCPSNGENSYGSVYGVYKNAGWQSSFDLYSLN